MADGEITLKLNEETFRRLRALASIEGVTPEEMAVRLLERHFTGFAEEATAGWIGPDMEADRAALDRFEKTRMGVPWEEVEAWMMSWGTDNPLPKPQARKL